MLQTRETDNLPWPYEVEGDNHTSTLYISHLIATANKDPSLFHVILRHCCLRSLATAKETVTAISDKLGTFLLFLLFWTTEHSNILHNKHRTYSWLNNIAFLLGKVWRFSNYIMLTWKKYQALPT